MISPEFARQQSPLLTDLYQLTMLQGYLDGGMTDNAVFECFVRRLPAQRNFLVAAGLEQAIGYVTSLRYSTEDIRCLAESGLFARNVLDYLAGFRFSGDVDAIPEGTVFFENEPLLRVSAPLPEAQLLESRLLNLLHFQTLIASKAARCVLAAPDSDLVDFGMRRAHGAEAALFAARASFLAGFAGTATVLAKPLFGIPIFGTMAHSFIEAHDSEIEAYEHFAKSHRGAVILLIDTYDTEEGARRVVELADRLGDTSQAIAGVRLDSGDLLALSRSVRDILDQGGYRDMRIIASGSIDEHRLQALRAAGAPIDSFGIGTSLDISSDAPALDIVYKMQEYAGRARRKRSAGKATWPGPKQVFRQLDDEGLLRRDCLTVLGDEQPGRALLGPVLRNGSRVGAAASLDDIRERVRRELAELPPAFRSLSEPARYRVDISPALKALAGDVDREFR